MPAHVKVGDTLPILEKVISQERINRWAELSGDFNLLHVDPAYAAKTPFKGTIAHGPMSLAFLNEFMMKCFETDWLNGGILADVRFVSPVRPGDRITVKGVVTAISNRHDRYYAECELSVEKQDGTKAVVGRGISPMRSSGHPDEP